MGWDAYSSVKLTKRGKIQDQNLRAKFKHAAKKIAKKTDGLVDGYFELGALDLSWCGKYLEKATGRSVYDSNGWSAELVANLHKEAKWDFKPHHEYKFCYWSAREFLRICAENGLSITFSW